jgi:hypothetical protein
VVLRCRSDGEALRVGGARNVAKQLEKKKQGKEGKKKSIGEKKEEGSRTRRKKSLTMETGKVSNLRRAREKFSL